MVNAQSLWQRYCNVSLVLRIVAGIIAGTLLAALSPSSATDVAFLGGLFVNALKAVAPILVFVLVISAVSSQTSEKSSHIRPILALYLIGTLAASLVAVTFSFWFPTTLTLALDSAAATAPEGIGEVLNTLLFQMVQNPITALIEGNFIGILTWAVGFGWLLRHANHTTLVVFKDVSHAVTGAVRFVIQFAPFGVFGLVANTIAQTGFVVLLEYSQLLAVLAGCMGLIAFVINPLIVAWNIRANPYPLVFQCLRESGVTAFFTRSSAANIPVNMQLCERLQLDEDTYSVSIPLGATINMAGAAITITVMTLAAVHTLNIEVDLLTALMLSVLAAISACGASGVAGGSLLLIPLACSLFGINNDVAMQVVAIGFIIGVVQDAMETALNSSTDVLFTAAACQRKQKLQQQAIL